MGQLACLLVDGSKCVHCVIPERMALGRMDANKMKPGTICPSSHRTGRDGVGPVFNQHVIAGKSRRTTGLTDRKKPRKGRGGG